MFQLTREELTNWKCQNVTSSWGGRRYRPYVFTEQGVAMLSSVLNSERAIEVNIQIMRTFIKLKQLLAPKKDVIETILKELKELKKIVTSHDEAINLISNVINHLLMPQDEPKEEKPKRKIGFNAD